VSGLAVVVGNAGVTAQITRGAEGRARRTLMAGQSVVVNAAASLGLLAGGPVLAGLGAPLTLTTTGLLTVAVSGGVLVVRGVGSQPKRPATSAARAPYPPPNRQACTSSGKS
jgi:predicted MFS family arabinose efflux permease